MVAYYLWVGARQRTRSHMQDFFHLNHSLVCLPHDTDHFRVCVWGGVEIACESFTQRSAEENRRDGSSHPRQLEKTIPMSHHREVSTLYVLACGRALTMTTVFRAKLWSKNDEFVQKYKVLKSAQRSTWKKCCSMMGEEGREPSVYKCKWKC